MFFFQVTTTTFVLTSPMEQFEILNIFDNDLINFSFFTLTNVFFILLFVSLLIISLFYFKVKLFNLKIIPTYFQLFLEKIILFFQNILKENINVYYYYFNLYSFLFFIFLLICFLNLFSIIPYTFALTSHLLFTFTLSLFCLSLVNKLAIERHGISFLSFFLPPGSPIFIAPFLIIIEFISYSARIFSLAIRLFANIMSGHILLKILGGFCFSLGFLYGGIVVAAIILIIYFLEITIALLQAYVFLTLVCIYFKEVIYLH